MATSRRTSATVRADLIAAAGYLFARRGYAGTSTKEIAERAGTYETSLYTHFGSKAGIFSAAVVEPFAQFAESFGRVLRECADEPEEVLTRVFVDELYDAMVAHHDAVMAFILVMREPDADEAMVRARLSIDAMFADLNALGRQRDRQAGRGTGRGRPLVQRLMVGLVVASTAFSPWLFSGPQAGASAERIKRALTEMLVSGVLTSAEPVADRRVRTVL